MSRYYVPSTHFLLSNGSDPTASPLAGLPTTSNDLKDQIDALLPADTFEVFIDAVNYITRIGRKPSGVEGRRKKLREIVSHNLQIVPLYNALAVRLASTQSQPKYRLPVFLDLEDGRIADDEGSSAKESGLVVHDAVGLVPEDLPVIEKVLVGEAQVLNRDEVIIQGDPQVTIARDSSRAAVGKPHFDGTSAIDQQRTGSNTPEQGISGKGKQKEITLATPDKPFHGDASKYTRQTIITQVQNPEVFPIERIQDIQALYYPSAKITAMRVFGTKLGSDIIVTAEMERGPFNHILINDSRLINALGLNKEPHDTLVLQPSEFRVNETFMILPFSTHNPENMKISLVGEMVPARHAFLHWLDSREFADPKRPPFVQEANRLAVALKRRAPDVWREIDEYWNLEQGAGGKRYRMQRERYLGEDPKYPDSEEKKPAYGMW